MSTKCRMCDQPGNKGKHENRICSHTEPDIEAKKPRMLTSNRVEGTVEYNNGEFAEVLTYGIEGIDKSLLLETIQIHVEDTENTPEEFQQRFPVGATLGILSQPERHAAAVAEEDLRRLSQVVRKEAKACASERRGADRRPGSARRDREHTRPT